MNIVIKNCNNIDSGTVTLEENILNLKYALNGTGKSTIAKAISFANDEKKLEKLLPFKHIGTKNIHPEIEGIPTNYSYLVFNEDYVNQYEFQKNELIQNTFEVFIKTQEYEDLQLKIDELLKETKNVFINNEDIESLLKVLNDFFDSYKATKSGKHSNNGSFGKGLAKGNKISNIPNGLEVYKPYIQSTMNINWLTWQTKGVDFLEIGDICPFCSGENIEQKKELIEKVGKEYEKTYLDHLTKVLNMLSILEDFVSDEAYQKVQEIKKNVAGITDEQEAFISNINIQISTLKRKLEKLKNLGYQEFKDVKNCKEELEKSKIDLSFISYLQAEKTVNQVNTINNSIDNLITRYIDLNKAISKERQLINTRIHNNEEEINNFLCYAGYNYNVKIQEDNEEYKLLLFSKDCSDINISGKEELSYGERNAFALVLFMYDALSKNPDLIILDDPISSFDGNKKFAILNRLFIDGKNSFRNKTVLMLTHEFSSVIDVIKTLNSKFSAKGCFLYNDQGKLTEKEITEEDVLSANQIMEENVSNLTEDINKLVYLRRYLELTKGTRDLGYNLISSLLHKESYDEVSYLIPFNERSTPEDRKRRLNNEEKEKALKEVREISGFETFDYNVIYNIVIDDSRMINIYETASNGYEKLQIYRVLFDKDPKEQTVIQKYINETFHIENEYLFQLNPCKYEIIPSYVINECNKGIEKKKKELGANK